MKCRVLLLCAALAFLAGAALPTASAQTYTWTPTGGGAWNSAANWSSTPGDFPNGTGVTATINPDLASNATINLNESISVGILNLGDLAGTQTVTVATGTGTNTLTFDNGGAAAELNRAGAGTGIVTISAPVNVGAGTVLNVSTGTGNISLSSVSGAGAINKVASNTSLTFGSTDHAFSGSLGSSMGTLSISGSGRLANVSSYSLRSTGFLDVSNTLTSGSNRLNSAATLNFNAGRLFMGGTLAAGLNVESGPALNLQSGTATLDFRGGPTTDLTKQYELTLSGIQRSQGAVLQIRADSLGGTSGQLGVHRLLAQGTIPLVGGGGAGNSTTASIIPWMVGGQGSAVVNNQPVMFVTYTANGFEIVTGTGASANTTATNENIVNASSGTTTLTANRTYNSLRFSNAGTHNLAGFQLTIGSGAVILGGATISNGTLDFGTAEGIVNVGGTSTGTISAAIVGSGGLTKASTGTLVLSGTNNFSGDTYISGGTLRIGGGNGLGSSYTGTVYLADTNVNSLAGGSNIVTQWDLNDVSQSIGALSGGGTAGGNVSLGTNAATTLTVGTNNTSTVYGGVISGSGGLVKQGAGSFTLTGASTYAGGTTISGGKILANNTSGSATGLGAVTVQNGAALGGGNAAGTTGFVNGLVVLEDGGSIAPGNSAGTLTLQSGLTLDSDGGSVLDFELGSSSDLIRITGGTLTGNTSGFTLVNVTALAGFGAGLYTLVDWTGAATLGVDAGDFALNMMPAGYEGSFSIIGSTLQVNFTAIPEPNAAVLLLAGLGMVLVGRRRRK